jgi:hypothetical protein
MKKIFTTMILVMWVLVGCQTIPTNENQDQAVEMTDTEITLNESSSKEEIEEALPTPLPTETLEEPDPIQYPIVDTGQSLCYDDSHQITCPMTGEGFYGQDGQVPGLQPAYQVNGDGTVTDLVTGLMWSSSLDLNGDGEINIEDKLNYVEASAHSEDFNLAGYDDWRLPTIKELYSLILFTGVDPSGQQESMADLPPFIDASVFTFAYGDTEAGERSIDAQFATSTLYTSTTMGGAQTMFGVNFADGRIKGYPVDKAFYVLYVRGAGSYGVNDFVDNGDGTISDLATGLMWSQDDSSAGMNWEAALAWVQEMNEANFLGYDDWRLPNAKELQSIVDYTRSPDASNSAAIDPIFNITAITNEAGQLDFPTFWTSTTHTNGSPQPGSAAAYIAFGRAMGNMRGSWMDVHGAGAQRSDPKAGSASEFPQGHGPQGDAIRIENYIRLVRDD